MASNIAERLGLTDEVREIKLGKTFGKGHRSTYYHTFRYDFKPASVDPKKMATVDIGEGHKVTVTVPHVDKGSGSTHAVFKGSKKPYQKECVLIIDHKTGEIQLEKLEFNVQLKKFRAEGSSKIKPIIVENTTQPNGKKSPVEKYSPQQRNSWSSNRCSPVPKCSPLPKSPNSQPSPPSSQNSLSVPSLVPPSSNVTNSRHSIQVPPLDIGISLPTATTGADDVALMSSCSESSSSSDSGSDSSDDETKHSNSRLAENSDFSLQKFLPNGINSPKQVKYDSQPSSALPHMPRYSQLSRDLELSESDSD